MSSGDGGLAAVAMPQGTKKMVQSLKEIVNCPEEEIYATLKDCDMDPNEAVNRLILQDSFHEVKKKREKKEAKGTPEYRSQYGNLNRGARGGFDRNGRNNDTYIKSSDNRVARSKLAQSKDYGASTVSNSDRAGKEQAMCLGDDIAFPPQPSSTSQHNWSGMQDHRSMADIVRMGRPHEKTSTPIVGPNASQSRTSYNAVASNKLQGSGEKNKLEATGSHAQSSQEVHSSEEFHSKGSYSNYEPVDANTVSQDTSLGDWSMVDQPPSENGQMYSESSAASSFYHEPTVPSTTHVDGDAINYATAPDGQIQVDNYEDNYCLVDGPITNIISYESPGHAYDFHEVSVEDASTKLSLATSKLQQLSLHGEQNVESAASIPAVIIPAHLQITNADCSHLCFGSFGSGTSAPLSEPFASTPMRNNFEASSRDNPSYARDSEHYDNEQLQSTLDKSTPSSTSANNGKQDTQPAPQPDIATDDRFNAHQLQHNSSSISGYSLTGAEQLNAAANYYAYANLQMQNFAPHSSAAALNPGIKSISQSSPQAVPNTSASTIPALPQHLPVHPYSHPTLPSAHFPSMAGYPFPQSYTYMPSAFQQANSDSSAFHQPAAAYNSQDYKYALPQYKSNTPANSFPPSASGYGGFGSSANVPGSSRKSGGYEEALSSQYRDMQQFFPPRQNENIPLWLQGGGSRTLPAAAYYNYQSPQSSIRQSYGAGAGAGAGYLNMYHSPPGVSQEHQQQQQHVGEGQGGQGSQLPHNWQRHY